MYSNIERALLQGGKVMETQELNEKKVWIKPQLIVYGDIDKLTTEKPVVSLSTT